MTKWRGPWSCMKWRGGLWKCRISIAMCNCFMFCNDSVIYVLVLSTSYISSKHLLVFGFFITYLKCATILTYWNARAYLLIDDPPLIVEVVCGV